MRPQRISPGQKWAKRTTLSLVYTVNEVYDNLDGGRQDYATMLNAEGRHAFTIVLDDLRDDFMLVEDVDPDTPRNPAEQRAADQGLPVVLADTHSLLMAISGHSIIMQTKDGGEALLRLARPDELTERHPQLPVETAERLVAPVRLP